MGVWCRGPDHSPTAHEYKAAAQGVPRRQPFTIDGVVGYQYTSLNIPVSNMGPNGIDVVLREFLADNSQNDMGNSVPRAGNKARDK